MYRQAFEDLYYDLKHGKIIGKEAKDLYLDLEEVYMRTGDREALGIMELIEEYL